MTANGFYRSLLAILFGVLITPNSGASGLYIIATAVVVILLTKFFLELCTNVARIAEELEKNKRK